MGTLTANVHPFKSEALVRTQVRKMQHYFSELIGCEQTLWVIQWTAALAEGLTKVSIVLLYRRILLGKFFIISTWFMMGLSLIWSITFFCANFCTAMIPCHGPIAYVPQLLVLAW